jgi:hypothetical protein
MKPYHILITKETSLTITKKLMRRTIKKLIKLMDMKSLGNCSFKPGNNVLPGFTAGQMIETSHINMHYFSHTGELWIDILSCKKFNRKGIKTYLDKIFQLK